MFPKNSENNLTNICNLKIITFIMSSPLIFYGMIINVQMAVSAALFCICIFVVYPAEIESEDMLCIKAEREINR